MPAVLASGLPPQRPPVFDPASHEGAAFDPPLKKPSPGKVVKSGLAPKPPPAFQPKDTDKFDPPLNQPEKEAPPPRRVFTSVPKVVASGQVPAPPPAFDPASAAAAEFSPPVTFSSE